MSDAVVNGLAGAGGGFVAQVLTYPLQAVSWHEFVLSLPREEPYMNFEVVCCNAITFSRLSPQHTLTHTKTKKEEKETKETVCKIKGEGKACEAIKAS